MDEKTPETPRDDQDSTVSDVEAHRHKQDSPERGASDEGSGEENADVEAHRYKQDRYKND